MPIQTKTYSEFRSQSSRVGVDLNAGVELILVMEDSSLLTDDPALVSGFSDLKAVTPRQDIFLFDDGDDGFYRSFDDAMEELVNQIVWPDLAAQADPIAGWLMACKSSHATHPNLPVCGLLFSDPINSNGTNYRVNVNGGSYLRGGDTATSYTFALRNPE